MAIIHFEDDGITAEFEDGILLQEAIARAGASIPFGCREGQCATCMIEVLDGMPNLSPVSDAEHYTLLPEELENSVRLACQLRVMGGEVRVRIADIF